MERYLSSSLIIILSVGFALAPSNGQGNVDSSDPLLCSVAGHITMRNQNISDFNEFQSEVYKRAQKISTFRKENQVVVVAREKVDYQINREKSPSVAYFLKNSSLTQNVSYLTRQKNNMFRSFLRGATGFAGVTAYLFLEMLSPYIGPIGLGAQFGNVGGGIAGAVVGWYLQRPIRRAHLGDNEDLLEKLPSEQLNALSARLGPRAPDEAKITFNETLLRNSEPTYSVVSADTEEVFEETKQNLSAMGFEPVPAGQAYDEVRDALVLKSYYSHADYTESDGLNFIRASLDETLDVLNTNGAYEFTAADIKLFTKGIVFYRVANKQGDLFGYLVLGKGNDGKFRLLRRININEALMSDFQISPDDFWTYAEGLLDTPWENAEPLRAVNKVKQSSY